VTDSLALDHETLAAQLATVASAPKPLRGIGGSDIAYLMVAFGIQAPETAPSWIRKKAERMPTRRGLPRGLAQRMGLAAQDRGQTLSKGNEREPEILAAWIQRLESGEWHHEWEREIDPDSVQWAGALPVEWVEHADTESPLIVHPDAWAKTYGGQLVTVEIKCARYGYDRPAWWNGATESPWYYASQIQAYHAVLRSTRGALIVGGGWNRDDDDPRGDGPLLALACDRDERAIAAVREVARRAWELVQKVTRA
jgi:hypothetical protein